MAVQRYDDLDGTEGAETVRFALDGRAYEIDLADKNAQAFRAMFGPYLNVARPAQDAQGGVLLCLPARLNQDTGQLILTDEVSNQAHPAVATAIGGGGVVLTGEDRYGRPALKLATDDATDVTPDSADPAAPSEKGPAARPPARPVDGPAQPSHASDTEVRNWAKRWSVPGLPTRGRVPAKIRAVHDHFHDNNLEPWKELLREHGVDPAQAEADARALTAVDSKKRTEPTQDERDRKAAERVGKLSSAQLTRLRRMYAAEDGRAVSDRKNGDTTSFEALAHRGCCIQVETDEAQRTSTYEITNVGRLWFEVRGIDPVGS
ncbi:histone-like nucleoid-structuring protein Lsr2 [Streptomyces sp. HMX87]|uniref:Lsr2 dimerization domain-containing protein n=1 Tax=Streptomyces sp. HMX87 TaxID=3390849 RepID=UPI003A8AE679